MGGYVDLHSHWLVGIDDGARTLEESAVLLRGLRALGFEQVCATPHMRPGMFDNDAGALRSAFAQTWEALRAEPDLPEVMLGSEHWLDDVVFRRLMEGQALPYPGGRAALVELPPRAFPLRLAERLFELKGRSLLPVIAHPERYEPVWKDPQVLEPLLDAGACLLLDVAALAGKYGRAPKKAAEWLVKEGYYQGACSDSHRPDDLGAVAEGMARLTSLAGDEEREFLLSDGPRQILSGKVDA